MKKFSYSLQKILDLRNFEKEQAEEELGKVNSEITKIQNELDVLAQKKFSAQYISDSKLDIGIYENTCSYIVFLDQKKEEYLNQMAKLKIIQDEKRKNVQQAMQNVKVLEKLKEKKSEDWHNEVLKEEELLQDDVITAKFGR